MFPGIRIPMYVYNLMYSRHVEILWRIPWALGVYVLWHTLSYTFCYDIHHDVQRHVDTYQFGPFGSYHAMPQNHQYLKEYSCRLYEMAVMKKPSGSSPDVRKNLKKKPASKMSTAEHALQMNLCHWLSGWVRRGPRCRSWQGQGREVGEDAG